MKPVKGEVEGCDDELDGCERGQVGLGVDAIASPGGEHTEGQSGGKGHLEPFVAH